MRIYLVGGAIRDKLMGKQPHDFDYTVVLGMDDLTRMSIMNQAFGPHIDGFIYMGHMLRRQGYKVFVMTHEHFTIRAHFPKGHKNSKLTADFVMARKEGPYSDGRHPDWVAPGELSDDLARRDFNMNAIAEDESGNLIDPFDGEGAISLGLIEAVGSAKARFEEDALRVLRALRFSVTLGFQVSDDVRDAMRDDEVLRALNLNISDERKMDEMNKMFRHDAEQSIIALSLHPGILAAAFAGKVNLEATMKQKGFN